MSDPLSELTSYSPIRTQVFGLTTPRRQIRRGSISPYSPNNNSETEFNTPQRFRAKDTRSKIFTIQIHPLSELDTPKNPSRNKRARSPPSDDETDIAKSLPINTHSFYKPHHDYVNPLERMALGKPKVWVNISNVPAKRRKVKEAKGKTKVARKTKENQKKTVSVNTKILRKRKNVTETNTANEEKKVDIPPAKSTGMDTTTPVKMVTDTPRRSPRTKIDIPVERVYLNASTSKADPVDRCVTPVKQPANNESGVSPRTALCLSLGITPPTPKTPPKRKFFTSRSPKKLLNRFTAVAQNGNYSFKKMSPKKKERGPSSRKPKSAIVLNQTETLDENVGAGQRTPKSLDEIFKDTDSNFEDKHSSFSSFTSSPSSTDKNTVGATSSPMHLYPIFNPGFRTQNNSPPEKPDSGSADKIYRSPKIICNPKSKDGKEQLLLDLGQKSLKTKQCKVCSMIYSAGEAEDELLHKDFHKKHLSATKFSGWKDERVVGTFADGKIIKILPTDPKFAIKKVEEVRRIVDRELGFPDLGLPNHERSAYFIFVQKRSAIGCIIAEPIDKAYRVLPGDKSGEASGEMFCCGTDPIPVICGISRIWTSAKHRRQKIASRLLDCVRSYFMFGRHLAINEIAFSDPSPMGRSFATDYMKRETFLVYK